MNAFCYRNSFDKELLITYYMPDIRLGTKVANTIKKQVESLHIYLNIYTHTEGGREENWKVC